MREQYYPSVHPVSFEPIETFSDILHVKNIHFGNSGGEYCVKEGTNFFEQHFAPDKSWDPAATIETQRKHATLYPAVLWEFLQWQESLSDTEPRKNITIVRGITNEVMSHFRSKLLGKCYQVTKKENPHNTLGPLLEYEIDLTEIKKDEGLLKKLRAFSERAKKMNYTTHFPPPQPGEMRRISIKIPETKTTKS